MSEIISSGGPIAPNAGADTAAVPRRRTAILVVHGMGSQRALDTVRGVVDAVWLDSDDKPGKGDKRYWLHPEKKNDDVDLSVLTTSEVPDTSDLRRADFHELYWAHLMSETRAVAVLLWLFELVRKGPRLKPGMRALWWGATIFLCLLIQSVVLLGLHAVLQFLGSPPLIDDGYHVQFGAIFSSVEIWLADHDYHEPEALLLAPFFVVFMAGCYVTVFSATRMAWKITIAAVVVGVISGAFFYWGISQPFLKNLTASFLPIMISLLVSMIAMGGWGVLAMIATYICASVFFAAYLQSRLLLHWQEPFLPQLKYLWEKGWFFWSLNERYSAVIAVAVISIYAVMYVLFLQPFLGDAARYFRAAPGNVLVRRKIRKQAVDTLDTLHSWGIYDRIIVVAHSLGTVVAYDMLRAYFSRVNSALPDCNSLEPEFSEVDRHDPDHPTGAIQNEGDFRSAGREIIRKIAAQTVNSPDASSRKTPAPTWLVTDFVTLGSPLTHAYYLMCDGKTENELIKDFQRRVEQREFPVCPPERQEDDGVLSFKNKGKTEFHHAALFGLTRWTNLYFPRVQLFWGDAVGGPLREIFGHYIRDIPVSTLANGAAAFFTHTSYWKITGPMGRKSPQIEVLRDEINLADKAT
jgi:pimeloyl-ACP methyl ester carboxylesterase